jgi:hypothetical protein
MEDDVSKEGWHMPKGSTVLANIESVDFFLFTPKDSGCSGRMMSKEGCSNPDVFRPERFLEDPSLRDPSEYIFGFGRRHFFQLICVDCDVDYHYRRCPGKHFGNASRWFAAATIVATLEIQPPTSDKKPDVKFTHSFVR